MREKKCSLIFLKDFKRQKCIIITMIAKITTTTTTTSTTTTTTTTTTGSNHPHSYTQSIGAWARPQR